MPTGSQIFFQDVEDPPGAVRKGLADVPRGHQLSVQDHPTLFDRDAVAGQADQSLDEGVGAEFRAQIGREDPMTITGQAKDHHVSPLRLPDRGELDLGPGHSSTKGELRHEDVVTDEKGWKHRVRGNVETLEYEGPNQERDGDRAGKGGQILQNPLLLLGFFGSGGGLCHQSSPSFSAARNASWGISTEPTRFMRFLPSFWRSRSLRLRVMSPP